MITLNDIHETLIQGVKQDPYFYRIVLLLDIFDNDKDEESLEKFRDGKLYRSIEEIPKEYYSRQIYKIEVCKEQNGALSIKFVII